MNRVPQPVAFGLQPYNAASQPLQADYSDDICDANFEALKALVRSEVESDDFEMVDGPAW